MPMGRKQDTPVFDSTPYGGIYNRFTADTPAGVTAPRAVTPNADTDPSGGIPRVQNDADYTRLPSGARFMAPDGTIRSKP